MDYTSNQRLVALTALQKAVKEEVDRLRAEVEDDMRSDYEDEGTTKKLVRLNGEKVGTVTLAMSKERYEIDDPAAFEEFALEYGLGSVVTVVNPARMHEVVELVRAYAHPEDLDELLSEEVVYDKDWQKGCEWRGGKVMYMDSPMEVPGVRHVPEEPKNLTVRTEGWGAVQSALRELPGGAMGLLEE
jgi:hypothetical protein